MTHGGDRRSARADIHHHGNPLWEYRKRLGVNQQELAERMYISQQTVSDVESGRRKASNYVLGWIESHPIGGDANV